MTNTDDVKIHSFLSKYDEKVIENAIQLREIIFANLPNITEQLDIPAKMIAYCYGQKYTELICVLIPSKKGLKLGFNRGVELPDPDGLLKGTGKISRYVEIKSNLAVDSSSLSALLISALKSYKERVQLIS